MVKRVLVTRSTVQISLALGFGSAASTLLFLLIALVTVVILMTGRVGLPATGR